MIIKGIRYLMISLLLAGGGFMATCKDFYVTARAWADAGKGYDNGFGYQCIGFIDGLNKAIGAGLTTYVRDNAAKNMYYDYASGAYHTAGWHTVKGNNLNDAEAKRIWNTLPNGAIVFWESAYQPYGHVAVKIAAWGSPAGDVAQQDGSNPYRPAHYFNSGACTESGALGFIGALVSDDDGWGGQTQGSGGSTQPNEPSSGTSAKDNLAINTDKIVNDYLNNMKKLFNQNVYKGSEDYLFNKAVKLTKGMNLWRVKLSDEVLKELTNALKKALKDAADAAINSTQPGNSTSAPNTSNPSGVTGNEGTEDEKIQLICKIIKQYCPNANAYGIAGMLGNFAAESGIDPTNFESKRYWDGTTAGPSWQELPTVENLFNSWGDFAALYGIPLNEGAYLAGNAHWLGLGLGQWTGPRAKALFDWCKSKNLDWWTCKGQMEFAFNGDGSNAGILKACLVNSEYVEEGVDNFYRYWERANVGSSVAHRNSEAKRLYPKVKAVWDSL